MMLEKNIDIKVSAAEVICALQQGHHASDRLLTEAENAVAMAGDLLEPATVYQWVDVNTVEAMHVVLTGSNGGINRRLNVGPHANLLKKAKSVMVAVHTIGYRIDAKVNDLNRAGEVLQGYLLDSVGVVALGKVGDFGRSLVEAEAFRRGWGVGPSMGPGTLVGWETSDQPNLCAFLDIGRIGVAVNDSSLLIPFKSVSTLVGMGPDYRSRKVGSVCGLCTLRNTCWRRRRSRDNLDHFR